MPTVHEEETIRSNLKMMTSPEFSNVALSESVGGNAGPSCYAVNMGLTDEGIISYVGNDPYSTNATLRIFLPPFQRRPTRLNELIVDITGEVTVPARSCLTKSTWLWNLWREKSERPIMIQFMDGKLRWHGLMELLRTKYPWLVDELLSPTGLEL